MVACQRAPLYARSSYYTRACSILKATEMLYSSCETPSCAARLPLRMPSSSSSYALSVRGHTATCALHHIGCMRSQEPNKSPRAPGVCVRDSRTSNVVVTGCLVRQKRDGICTQMRSSCARAALWATLSSSVIFWVRGALRMHDAAVLVLASCHECSRESTIHASRGLAHQSLAMLFWSARHSDLCPRSAPWHSALQ